MRVMVEFVNRVKLKPTGGPSSISSLVLFFFFSFLFLL